jgi:hypothetical protein
MFSFGFAPVLPGGPIPNTNMNRLSVRQPLGLHVMYVDAEVEQ